MTCRLNPNSQPHSILSAAGRFVIRCGILLVCCAVSGCFLAPLFEPVRKGGFTASARRGLITERVDLLHRLIAQNRLDDAITLTSADNRAAIRSQLEAMGEGYIVTGFELRKRTDDEDSSTSRLVVGLQRYKVGRNMIENVVLTEDWSFSHADGWLLSAISRG